MALVLSLVAPIPPATKATVAQETAAARAVSAFELAWWRKNHPKADLDVTFRNPAVTPVQVSALRSALGYPDPMPVLDLHVLTIVFDHADVPAPKRLGIEAYVFLGSFPKGFRARYLIQSDGKAPRVLSRTVLERYEIAPSKT